tara:strand:- start:645 stop:971 length:327 start_codon:yes stop_codon:yes gene_type:complete
MKYPIESDNLKEPTMPIKFDHQFNTYAGLLWAILGAPSGLTGFPARLVVRLMALLAPLNCRALAASNCRALPASSNGSSAKTTKLNVSNMPALMLLGHPLSPITRAYT